MPRRRGRRRRRRSLLFFAATAVFAAVYAAVLSSAHLLDLPPLPPPPPQQQQKNSTAEVCFVVRTYWKHGEAAAAPEGRRKASNSSLQPPQQPTPPPLARLLRSLRAQSSPSWVALLLVADEDPFLGLETVIEDALRDEKAGGGNGDDRVWVWARSSGPGHRAKEEFLPSHSSSSSSSSPRPRLRWARGFHRGLFALTDDAVQWGCPRASELVVVTNGDNAYAPRFVEAALAEARGGKSGKNPSDLVLFDYASRYARPTGVPCERFGEAVEEEEEEEEEEEGGRSGGKGGNGTKGDGGSSSGGRVSSSSSSSSFALPYCKRNLGRWCHTDLGAVAFRLSRLRGEEGGSGAAKLRRRRRFSDAETLAAAERAGLSPDSLDGVFVEDLIKSGEWVVRRVAGSGGGEEVEAESGDGGSSGIDGAPSSSSPRSCLFDHAPSPHACALSGGVWDDSAAATPEVAGGECVSEREAERRLLEAPALGSESSPPPLELVSVRVFPGDGGGGGGAPPLLRCLRWRDREKHHQSMMAFFGRCAEEE